MTRSLTNNIVALVVAFVHRLILCANCLIWLINSILISILQFNLWLMTFHSNHQNVKLNEKSIDKRRIFQNQLSEVNK